MGTTSSACCNCADNGSGHLSLGDSQDNGYQGGVFKAMPLPPARVGGHIQVNYDSSIPMGSS